MQKCLKIVFPATMPQNFLAEALQGYAKELCIEGTAQIVFSENVIRIIACGAKEHVDALVDFIHKETQQSGIEELEIEPFLKDRDYRGVFRVIE